jgi:exodeoxyribonuclease VII large subunit
LERRTDRLRLRPIHRDISQKQQQLAQISRRFGDAADRQTKAWRDRIDGLDRLRETLGYKATLQRGYAVVRGDGDVVTTKTAAAKARELEIEFADGRLALSQAQDGQPPVAKPARKPAKSTGPKSDPPDQGSLF